MNGVESTTWCKRCNTRQVVDEASEETVLDATGELTLWVQRLVCGHTVETERGYGYKWPVPAGLPRQYLR